MSGRGLAMHTHCNICLLAIHLTPRASVTILHIIHCVLLIHIDKHNVKTQADNGNVFDSCMLRT